MLKSPYPEYNVLEKWHSPSFDDTTRAVLTQRLHAVPSRRFFSPEEWQILEAVCDLLLPQEDREDKIPITPWIDDMIVENRGEGFRHDNMPPLREAWRTGLAAIDKESRQKYGDSFLMLDTGHRTDVLKAIQDEKIDPPLWDGVPAKRFFIDILLKTAAGIYYSHPAAWSEIGFGGPASPRGYVRLGFDAPDPWDGEEKNER